MNGNNQISSAGFSYDADGDMTGDANYSYAFNGADEITSANGVNYTGACPERSRRDGDALYASRMALRDGLRVEKSTGTLYWRAYTGRVIEARSLRPERFYGKTNTSGGMQRDYIFFAGRRIAWKDSSGNVYYYFADEPRDPSRRMTGEGLTLLEVLIVIAIMLIIVAIALPRITPMLEAARKTTIVAKLRILTNELSVFHMDCGGYPENPDALKPSPGKGCSTGTAFVSSPKVASGYRLAHAVTNRDETGHYEGYTLSAVPSSTDSADGESYFADQSGIIRVHRDGPAPVSDPALVP